MSHEIAASISKIEYKNFDDAASKLRLWLRKGPDEFLSHSRVRIHLSSLVGLRKTWFMQAADSGVGRSA